MRGLDKRMNAVYTEKTIDDTTIQDLIEHSRGQDHTIGDNVEAADDL